MTIIHDSLDLNSHQANLSMLASQLKVLAEPNRLRIIELLMSGVQCNCNLGENLGMPPNLISHHLRVLRRAGLVSVQRSPTDARWLHYSLDREALDRLMQNLEGFLDPDRVPVVDAMCGPQAG